MKRLLICLLAVCFLCACEADSEGESRAETSKPDATTVLTEFSDETVLPCEHAYGDEPVEIVGNLYIFECIHCGQREVVPQGTLIGGE